MKTAKRLLFFAFVIAVAFSMVTLLAACNDEDDNVYKAGTFKISWSSYMDDIDELQSDYNLPSVQQKSFGDDVVKIDTSYASNGLITLRTSEDKYYGYLLHSDITFGVQDGLTNLSYGYHNTFRGKTADGVNIIYDSVGNKIASGASVGVNNVKSAKVNGRTKYYLEIDVDGVIEYHERMEDGSFSVTGVAQLPQSNGIPGVGDSFASDPESLFEAFEIDEDEPDSFMENTYARIHNRTLTFYDKNGKKISSFLRPTNADILIYIDKNIVYSTLTPVDPMATQGFNYIKGDSKYLSKIYNYNISSGKTQELKVDYVLAAPLTVMYNKDAKAHDLATVNIYRMVDGVAWADKTYLDTVIINTRGDIGFSTQNSSYGMPMASIGKNYLYFAPATRKYNIVDAKGDLVAELGDVSDTMQAVLSDGFLVRLNGKLGVVGFDGKVTIGFEYYAVSSVYGDYVLVTDLSDTYCVLSGKSVKSLTSITLANAEDIEIFNLGKYKFIRVYDRGNETYDFYNLDGTKIISNAVSSAFATYVTFTQDSENSYMFCSIDVKTASGTETQYYRIAL